MFARHRRNARTTVSQSDEQMFRRYIIFAVVIFVAVLVGFYATAWKKQEVAKVGFTYKGEWTLFIDRLGGASVFHGEGISGICAPRTFQFDEVSRLARRMAVAGPASGTLTITLSGENGSWNETYSARDSKEIIMFFNQAVGSAKSGPATGLAEEWHAERR